MSRKGEIASGVATVRDLYPTILEWSGIDVPANTSKPRLQGRSLFPVISGSVDDEDAEDVVIGWEIFGGRALREGDWKLTWVAGHNGKSRWELFNIALDPGETNDLSSAHPERVDRMLALWSEYVDGNGVVLPEGEVHGAWGDAH